MSVNASCMNRLDEVARDTEEEMEEYLEFLGWEENPFLGPSDSEQYVFPNRQDIEDVVYYVQNYTGFIIVHSRYSGAGKTTLARVILEQFEDSHETIFVPEHNVTPYELIGIVADELGVGKSSSTKMTEQKIRDADIEEDVLIAVDEYGLNDPDTLHILQFLNDEGFKILLTGMTSQWEAIGKVGSEGRAFQRRAGLQLELEPFDFEKTVELVKRRIAPVAGYEYDEWEEVSLEPFITKDALAVVHDGSEGVPAVVVSSLADLLGAMAHFYSSGSRETATAKVARTMEFTDALADE